MTARHKTLPASGVNAAVAIGGSGVFGRDQEIEHLRQRFAARRSFLFHGPAGVGKTLLLGVVRGEFPDILYSRQNPTPHSLYRNLAEALLALENPVVTKSCPRGMDSLQAKSAVSLKGLVRNALEDSKFLVVADHLVQPSQALAAAIRELMLNWSVPVVAVSRSAHMEDAGFVRALFPDRTERFALQNFEPEAARRFASGCAEREGLTAENLEQFLDRVVDYCDGNPGAMLQIVPMARSPKYSHENQIKVAPLCIDYRISMINR